ncbi:MAG: hypothetical protein ABNH00_15595 [Dokdonia sp.]|jgi:hypothetical protein
MTRFLCTLGLLISYAISAQTNFEKGSYTDNLGTTHSGYIKNLDWKDNPTAFEFSSTPDGVNSEIIPMRAIQQFSIKGKSRYLKKKVYVDLSPSEVNNLNYNRSPDTILKTVLLKLLIDGDTKLYRYKEGKNLSLYFSKDDEKIELLVYKRYLNTQKDVVTNNYYQQQLQNEFSCEGISMPKVSSVRYSTSDIVDYITKYNACMGFDQKQIDQRKREKALKFTLIGGSNFNSYTADINNLESFDFGSAMNLTYGFEIEYIFPHNNDRWAIFIDTRTHRFDAKQQYTRPSVLGVPGSVQDVNFTYRAVEIAAGVRHYFYLGKKSRLFVSANYAAEATSSSVIDLETGRDSEVKLPVGTYGLGFGYNYGDLRIEARYNGNKNHFSKGRSRDASTYTSFMLTLGYTFARF